MNDQIRHKNKANRILNILLGLLQLALIVGNGLTENWVKVSDPIANAIYFNILIPNSVAVTFLAIFFAIKKSDGSFIKFSRIMFNVLMLIAVIFFSIELFDNF